MNAFGSVTTLRFGWMTDGCLWRRKQGRVDRTPEEPPESHLGTVRPSTLRRSWGHEILNCVKQQETAGPGSRKEQLLQLLPWACQVLASRNAEGSDARSSTASREAGCRDLTWNLPISKCWQQTHKFKKKNGLGPVKHLSKLDVSLGKSV